MSASNLRAHETKKPTPPKRTTSSPKAKARAETKKAESNPSTPRSARAKSNVVAIDSEPESSDGLIGQLGQVIANHVRSRRLEIGLNVGQLAERTGISKGMLSKIENAQTSPSLSTLERLSLALDMPVTSLFRGLAEERDAVFVKAGSGPEIVRKGTRSGHTYQLLGTLRGPSKRVEPLLVSLAESSEVFPLFQHPGVEMLYMLEGVMEYSYGREHYRMEKGDTLQFEGDIPHGPTQLVKLPIRFLSITVYSGDRS
jgi:quercetin dioxygenase-like cupin family protein/ribosome-binding protein aMBF1 (putative translation factor)